MANTMLNKSGKNALSSGNNGNLAQNVAAFARNLKKQGINPEQYLNELIESGRFTKQQIETARKLAYASRIKL